MRKIQGFIEGWHGDAVFMTFDDVYHVHEADHDGDTVAVEKLPKELEQAWIELQKSSVFKARNRIVRDIFKTNASGGHVTNRKEYYQYFTDSAKSKGAQGMTVNAKTILAALSYKNFSFTTTNAEGTVEVHKLSDPTIMEYWPLDLDKLNKKEGNKTIRELMEEDGDSFVAKVNGEFIPLKNVTEEMTIENVYLQTTKEQEFSYLLQMAVDDAKFRLLKDLPGEKLMDFLFSRIFKVESGKTPYYGNILKDFRAIYSLFNYSAFFQGRDEKGYSMNLSAISKYANEIYEQYNDIKTGEVRNNAAVKNVFKDQLSETGIQDFNFKESNITPREQIILNFARLAKDGINPELTSDEHNMTHAGAKDALYDKYKDRLSKIQQFRIEQLKKIADKIYEDITEIIKEAEKTKKNLAEEQDTSIANVNYDYNESIEPIVRDWLKKFQSLSKVEKEYITWYFLNNTSQKNYMMPVLLLDKDVMSYYAERYYDIRGRLEEMDTKLLKELFQRDYVIKGEEKSDRIC